MRNQQEIKMKADISEFMGTAPFESEGVHAGAYVPIHSILGTKIEIMKIRPFTNNKGDGVAILFTPDNNGAPEYFVTHAVGIVAMATKADVMALVNGDDENAPTRITATIIERPSTTSDRTVYAFKSAN